MSPPLKAPWETALALSCGSAVPSLYAAVVLFAFVYVMWAALQDGPARTTPGRAVGFMCIPFFNFYWIFQVYWGWTKDCNRYLAEKEIDAPRMPETLALTLCILILVAVVPVLGMFVSFVNLVLILVLFSRACDAINAIAAARPRQGAYIRERLRRARRFILVAVAALVTVVALLLLVVLLIRAGGPNEIEPLWDFN